MLYALLLMTGKLLLIYAFNALVTDKNPNEMQVEAYLNGVSGSPPLDWHNFPELSGDLHEIQQRVVGNPMYDPAGMLVALVGMSVSRRQGEDMEQKLNGKQSLIG